MMNEPKSPKVPARPDLPPLPPLKNVEDIQPESHHGEAVPDGPSSVVVGTPGWHEQLEAWGMIPAFDDENDGWLERRRKEWRASVFER
jgi:hypothetical protein